MKLTDKSIENTARPPGRGVRKLGDGGGLFLMLKGTTRRWRMKISIAGRETTLGFGNYPEVTIEQARLQARAARQQITAGKNPAAERRVEKLTAATIAANTFAKVGEEFLLKDTHKKAPKTKIKHRWLFESLRTLHSRPLAEITAPELLRTLMAIQAQGKREAAHRCAQFTARVYRFAINRYPEITQNPADNLRGELDSRVTVSHAAIVDPRKFGELMRFIDSDDYSSFASVRHGLQLLARTMLRPGELRQAVWTEIDFDKAEWSLPAHRMKMKRPHLAALSTQSIAILKRQKALTGDSPLVFPSARPGRPMSDAAMNMALKQNLWPSSEHTPHGFRSSASTLLNENGFDSALVELQLSHAKRDKIASIYDRSQRVPERRVMMQAWSDLIDTYKEFK